VTPFDVERCAHWLTQVGTIDRMLRSRKLATLTVLVDGVEVTLDTIRRRIARTEGPAVITAEPATLSDVRSATDSPSSLSHARFSALTARLAQIAARAAADSLAEPACAHDPVLEERILRFLSDVRRIAEAIADIAAGHCPVSEDGR
jgi:hypothetical protein